MASDLRLEVANTMTSQHQSCRVGLVALLAAFAAAISSPETSLSAATTDSVTLELAFFDRVDLPQRMLDRVFAEAEEVLLQLGAEPVWHVESPELQVYDPGHEIQIILSSSRPEQWLFSPRTMGAVLPIGNPPRRLVFVFPAEVARLLGLRSFSSLPHRVDDNMRFAKALGRVIAHELVHAIAPEHPHADDGIMLGRHAAASLLDPKLEVDRSCAAAFRSGLVGLSAIDTTPGSSRVR